MIEINNSCLLCIDIQKAYSDIQNFDLFKNNITNLLKYSRKNNLLITHIFEIDSKDKSKWLNFWEELKGKKRILDRGLPFSFSKPLSSENVIYKNGYDAFFDTNLLKWLKKNKVKTLCICGLLTSICVLNTIFSAFNNGFRIILIENCCSDRTQASHNNTIKNYKNNLFKTISF